MTANDKYFLLNRKNLQEPIRTQLSKKQKLFVNFLQDFWRLHQVLNNLKIKVTLIADIFLKLQNVKSVVTKMSKNPRFRMPFDRQHVKVSQTLLKSVLQHFYHILKSLWQKLCSKMHVLVISDILGLFLTHWLPMTSILFWRYYATLNLKNTKLVRIIRNRFY